ncbi:MAG TPA: protein phosphatase 2C domain-containing protein [Candidatus Eisenbacteria bacterium]|nr:protein phosphatase 2C domain-containing protein [Candidatus Eisenbacteria bacterium]
MSTDKAGETVAASRVRVEVAGLTDIGRARDTNEDAYLVCRIGRFLERMSSNVPESLVPRVETSGYVMIVADGMGGHAAGEVASHTAIAATLKLILDTPKWSLKLDDPATREREIGEIWERAREFLAAIHAAVQERAATDQALEGMGTTLTIAYSVGADLFVVHVGDSRAYLFRDGEVRKITRDHTLAQQYVDMGLVKPEEADSGPFSHVLTRAVGGNQERPEADLEAVQLAHGDRLLLCTDGLSNSISEIEMAAVLASGVPAADACRALIDRALAASGSDNITAVVADYTIDPA